MNKGNQNTERVNCLYASPAELAKRYNVCVRTIRRWLIPHMPKIGERAGRYFTPLQVKRIYECIGEP